MNFQDAIEQEKKMNKAQRMMDESRRRVEADLRNAESKVCASIQDISLLTRL